MSSTKEDSASVHSYESSDSEILAVDSMDDLLPPSRIYAGRKGETEDKDLDAVLEIEMEDEAVAKQGSQQNKKNKKGGCCSCKKVGNVIVWNQTLYRKYKLGVVGPHWPGLIFTIGLLYFASYYFTMKAYEEIGITSAVICIWLTIQSTVALFSVACRDPSIVMDSVKISEFFGHDYQNQGEYSGLDNHTQGEEEGWRYCGACEVYQPPSAAHCPDCNVCVDGYDHHCPWMGQCIGKNNFRSFMFFNVTWLTYLIYACAWVTAIGPNTVKK